MSAKQTLISFIYVLLSLWTFSSTASVSWPSSKKSAYSLVDPVFTGYNAKDYSINLDIIPEYAQLSSANGVDVILLGGSTAEWPSLTSEERLSLLKAWRSAVDNLDHVAVKPQILFHAGDISITKAQVLASQAKENGADAILIVSPCIMKPKTLDELVQTIKVIAAETSLPAVYYHYPALYNVNFPMDQFLDKAMNEIPTLAGVKFIDSNMKILTNATGIENGTFTLFNNDPLLAGMVAGSKGAISYTTLFPMVKNMHVAYESGDMDTARDIQRRLLEYDEIIGQYGSKSAARNLPLIFKNIDLGPPRPPLLPQTKSEFNEFKQALVNAGFLPRSEL